MNESNHITEPVSCQVESYSRGILWYVALAGPRIALKVLGFTLESTANRLEAAACAILEYESSLEFFLDGGLWIAPLPDVSEDDEDDGECEYEYKLEYQHRSGSED